MELDVGRKTVRVSKLHEDMLAALPGAFTGLSTRSGAVIVHLVDTEDDRAVAKAWEIVEAHDPSSLTVAEAAEKAEADADTATVLAANAVVLGSADPVEILEARIVRLETYIRQLQN